MPKQETMETMETTCPGCSCLCDDIIIERSDEDIKVKNACRRGAAIFKNFNVGRAVPMVEGQQVEVDEAISTASELIADSTSLAVYGMDTTTIEAQKLAIELAEKKQAYIDDCSSFCLGDLVEMSLNNDLPTTKLDEVRHNAYTIIYWGSNPFHSLPRHMSRYSYYPRGRNRSRGYEEDRFLVIVDTRSTHTSSLVKRDNVFFQVESDSELINAFMDFMDGNSAGEYTNKIAGVLRKLKKGDAVIFGGLGLKYGLNGDYGLFREFMEKLNQLSSVYFMPAGSHSNMRGFNEMLHQKTGCVNRYSFAQNRSGDEFEFSNLLREKTPDTVLIIGSDPVNSLPLEVSKELSHINTVLIDPRRTYTERMSNVVIPSALSGIETGGMMIRSDGVEVELNPVLEKEINDEFVLQKLLEGT
ncbi:MAG: formylmethanofuran dehydrogenase subunit B [Archaeoglobaceae archaeon]